MTQPATGPQTVEFTLHDRTVVLHLPDTTDHIQKTIWQRQGFYEPELLDDMFPHVRPGDLCLDVGAHIGNHTVFLAAICGARVLAFEPQPDVFETLQRNLEINGLQDRVTAVNVALGAAAGHGSMKRALPNNTGTARVQLAGDGPVTVTTLDEQVGEQRVALIKIDVEGFELEVLRGAERTIDRDHPIIYAEAMDLDSRKKLEAFLVPRGYLPMDQFSSTPVLSFIHCRTDAERFAALSARMARGHREMSAAQERQARALTEMARNLDARSVAVERKVAELESLLGSQIEQFERLARGFQAPSKADHAHTALLYELWNLGLHTHAQAQHPGRTIDYRPLNDVAGQLGSWRPKRRTWTVPRGSEAEPFLQGYTSQLSVHPGGTVEFRLSTDRPGTFAVIRVFRIGQGHGGGREVHTSRAICVPVTGVWHREGRDQVDPARWAVVYKVTVEDDWKPGCYLARFETFDGKANQHPFWVTSRGPSARTVLLSSVLSHIAHNRWGRSKARNLAARLPVPRRLRLPGFDRFRSIPLHAPHNGSRGGRALQHEVPFLRWADANQLPLDCITDVELHQQPELLGRWEEVVIAGDASYCTREVVEALRAYAAQGGNLTVLGAAPCEQLVTVDLEAGVMTLSGQRTSAADDRLWSTSQRGSVAKAAELRFRPQLLAADLGEAGASEPPVVTGLCGDRISGSSLADDDPALLARTTVRTPAGERRCDTVLTTTPGGGRLFVAGTDRWTWGLDDFISHKGVEVSTAIRQTTARILGVKSDVDNWHPLITVIMTAHNSADCLSRAVDSILAQTYANLELIVVDDASTDGTFELLLQHAARDRRVRPLRCSRNHGTYWSKNLGITRARGELITFQDSDDISEPQRLEVQVEALRRNPQAIGSTVDYVRVNERGEVLLNRGLPQRRAFPSLLYRADKVAAQIGFFDSVRSAADQEHFHRLRLAFPDADIIDTREPLYRALVREGSLTRSGDSFVKLGPDAEDDPLAHLSQDRREYVLAYEKWHARIARGEADPWMPFPLPQRPFPVPDRLGIDSGRTKADLDPDALPGAVPAELRLVREPAPAAPDSTAKPFAILTVARADEPVEVGAPAATLAPPGTSPGAAAPAARPAAPPPRLPATAVQAGAGTSLGLAELAPDSVYRVLVEFDTWPRTIRGRVVGLSRATGKPLFEVVIDGERPSVGTYVFTDHHTDRVDVRLLLEGSNGHAPTGVRFQATRRGERPPRSVLDLTDRSVTAAMATYPGRRQVLPAVVDTLVAQVDKLFIYLNNYQEVPPFISRHPHKDRIVFVLEPASQRRAAAKFYWLDQVRGYHLICDDDILYPPDYAARMVATLDAHERRAIAGVHGVLLAPNVDDARGSRRAVFKFDEALASDTRVHVLGTGTVALHSDVLPTMDLSLFHAYPIANDEILGVSAKDAGIPMICVARADDWLRQHPDVKVGIFEERSVDTREHDRATDLLAAANPWPDLSGDR